MIGWHPSFLQGKQFGPVSFQRVVPATHPVKPLSTEAMLEAGKAGKGMLSLRGTPEKITF